MLHNDRELVGATCCFGRGILLPQENALMESCLLNTVTKALYTDLVSPDSQL